MIVKLIFASLQCWQQCPLASVAGLGGVQHNNTSPATAPPAPSSHQPGHMSTCRAARLYLPIWSLLYDTGGSVLSKKRGQNWAPTYQAASTRGVVSSEQCKSAGLQWLHWSLVCTLHRAAESSSATMCHHRRKYLAE